jgi:ABC-type transport system involved in multi-copper enzyme maturation permease subunit
MRRELAIALRARVTWLVAALGALLVGHGFVLAVDLFSASSRSALASALQAQQMDPLAGVIRPTLGGVDLVAALFVPLVATRVLAVEKERGSFGALCLQVGSPTRVVVRKAIAATLASAPVLIVPIPLFALYATTGGHVDAIETSVAMGGELLHLLLIVAVSIAAASWTRTVAQAATIAIVVSLTSWAIDAGEGFAALAWLGGASAWSIERQIAPFSRGVVALGSIVWPLATAACALAMALVGARMDWTQRRRTLVAVGIAIGTVVVLSRASRARRAYDWTEQRRASLPPAAVDALRGIDASIVLDVFLDRDDSRRRQLESDVLAKLILARPDIVVRMPLDDARGVAETVHDADYGRIVLRVGYATRETRSTSRKEVVTLLFDAAGKTLPDWTSLPYPGYPAVVEGTRRRMLLGVAYGALPLAMVAMGIVLTRKRIG